MKKALLKEATRIALDKLTDHPQRSCFPHYSFIIQDNKIIEYATNIVYEPPRHYGYHNRPGVKPKLHAEVFAYKRARGILESDYFEIINIRLNKKGEFRLSKPCPVCYELLVSLGCKKFFYSYEYGFLSTI